MTEIEKLILAVESRGAADVNKQLDDMDKKVKTTEKSWGSLKSTVAGFVAAGVAVAGVAYLITKKLTESTRSYQDYNAQLVVATKSQANATQAYEALVNFATQTPYSVKEGTDAFIKLVNLGLNPSERALRSYGNTASAMNRQLIDFVDAVGHASTGQFESLRSFGVQAINMGAKVAFSFQGTTTTVANNAKAIEGYLMSIGENQFAGAMEKRMKTLTGVMSNLEDAWDQMWVAIAQQGPDSLITRAFQMAGDALTEITAEIKSGQLQAELKAIWMQVSDIGDVFKGLWDLINPVFKQLADWLGLTDSTAKQVFSIRFPSYAKLAFNSMKAEANLWKEETAESFIYVADFAKIEFERILALAEGLGEQMGRAVRQGVSGAATVAKGFATGGVPGAATAAIVATQDAINKGTQTQGNWLDDINAKYDAQQEKIRAAYEEQRKQSELTADSIDKDLNTEWASSDALFGDQMNNANKLRAAYDATQEAKKGKGDQLSQFQVQGTGGISAQEQKALDDAKRRAFDQNVKDLEGSLVGENEVVSRGYQQQRDIILASVTDTEEQKKDKILQLLNGSIMSEHDALVAQYEARRQFILSDTQLTGEQQQALLTRLAAQQSQAMLQLDLANQKKRLDAASTFFGNIASIGSTFGKKGFEIAKAAAIAQATIKTYESATSAYASLSGIPYVGPALGAAAAAAAIVAGAANIAQIKAQQYTPAYAMGGMIPAGKVGLVGEAGPEIVKGPAIVTSAATTSSMMNRASSGVANVSVHNYGAPADVSASTDPNGNLMLILTPLLEQNKKQTKTEMAHEVLKGGTPFTKNVEKIYGLGRGNNA